MKTRLTVLFPVTDFARDGAQRQLLELIKGLDKRRFAPIVMAISSGGAMEAEYKAVPGARIITLERRGKFDLVYSTYSLHHWKEPEESIRNLWGAVADNGILYIYDFKKIGWICSLPFRIGDIKLMRAALSPDEVRTVFKKIGVTDYKIKTVFPNIFQSIIARK